MLDQREAEEKTPADYIRSFVNILIMNRGKIMVAQLVHCVVNLPRLVIQLAEKIRDLALFNLGSL